VSTKYDYSLEADFAHGLANDLLARQITDANLGQALENVKSVGDAVSIYFTEALSGPGKTALDALVAAHDPTNFSFAENYLEEEYSANKLQRRTWFATKSGADYLYKVTETTYTHADAYLTGEQLQTFALTGAPSSTRTWVYTTEFVGSDIVRVHKEEVT
jgi:hypothetical protein